ncbi:MAG TPA: AbrB/MazE/SpoVT family DNA-binding domain-containing protein [Acidimicrobiales bacterium]|nr:AbrB/MazE/SpoVT family DNA-binding domain-containing protein [Acidimicrobiales bacterium]
MRTTIDKAGRVVIPKSVRDALGLGGDDPVDILIDGTAIRIEPVATSELVEVDGFLVVPPTGVPVTFETVDEIRRGLQR